MCEASAKFPGTRLLTRSQAFRWRPFVLTGHGPFPPYLKRFRISRNECCPCDSTTPQTIPRILSCRLFRRERTLGRSFSSITCFQARFNSIWPRANTTGHELLCAQPIFSRSLPTCVFVTTPFNNSLSDSLSCRRLTLCYKPSCLEVGLFTVSRPFKNMWNFFYRILKEKQETGVGLHESGTSMCH